jgi:hypothetical protein
MPTIPRSGPAALALLAVACATPSTSVTPILGSLSLDGSVGAGSSDGAPSTSMDSLGLGTYEAAPGVKAQLGILGGLLSVSAIQSEYEGSGTTDGAFQIGDQMIDADTDVDSKLELLLARALFTWNLMPLGPVEFGIGFGASVIDLDLSMTEQATGDELQTEEALPVPVVAARASWTWGPVRMRAELSGVAYTLDGDQMQVFDGDLESAVTLYESSLLVVGYRWIDVEAEYEDEGDTVDADLELSGFYFGVRFTF